MKSILPAALAALATVGLHPVDLLAADPSAKAVVSSVILNGNVGNQHTDPTRALGPSDETYVSMGGPGASLILDMGAGTPVMDRPGPDLEVREIGAAFGGVDESYRVLVSNSTDTNTFVLAGVGRALSLIDIAPSGLASARYVWLQDLATETLNSQTPGSDIDSLRSLHYSGGDGTIPPPGGLALRPTGQGAWLSWTPSSATNITGYAIRRSLDGVSFASTADARLSSDETAWHDTDLPAMGRVTYAVSALTASGESELRLVTLEVSEIALSDATPVHLGNDTVAGWEDPVPDRDWTVNFTLPGGGPGPEAELVFEAFDVDHANSPVLINGGRVADLPTQSAENWAARSIRFPAGALQPGINQLRLVARTSTGAVTGELDDFQVRNLRLRTYGVQDGIGLLTSTRFTRVDAGATTVTLRWVVEQTPTLSPPVWETVSGPIEWRGAITATNGFYRLRDLP